MTFVASADNATLCARGFADPDSATAWALSVARDRTALLPRRPVREADLRPGGPEGIGAGCDGGSRLRPVEGGRPPNGCLTVGMSAGPNPKQLHVECRPRDAPHEQHRASARKLPRAAGRGTLGDPQPPGALWYRAHTAPQLHGHGVAGAGAGRTPWGSSGSSTCEQRSRTWLVPWQTPIQAPCAAKKGVWEGLQ